MPTAPLTPIFANAAGELFAHPDGFALLRYRPGPWLLADLQALITQMGALLVSRGWQRLLSDARLLPALSDEAKAWLTHYWQEGRIARPALVYVVVLEPAAVFARLAVAQLQAQGQGKGNTRYARFADEAAAYAHLATLPR